VREHEAGNRILEERHGVRFSTWGDAAGRGYNGTVAADDPSGGERLGHLDYQWHPADPGPRIALVSVGREHRRRGVATALLDRLRHEFPGRPVDPGGYSTPEGGAW